MRGWISLVAAVVCFFTPLACRPTVAHGEAGAKTRRDMQGAWRMELRPIATAERAGAAPFEEALLVEGDRMTPETFALYGFEPATITFGDAERFEAVMLSRTKGTLAWAGRATRDAVAGSVVWTRADGTEWKFRYVARRPARE